MPRPVALTRPEEETMSASITPASPVGTSEPPAPAWNRQRHSPMSSHRYSDVFSRVDVPLGDHRQWPGRRPTAAPLWVPVDLRDGNQALAEPMSPQRKRRFYFDQEGRLTGKLGVRHTPAVAVQDGRVMKLTEIKLKGNS